MYTPALKTKYKNEITPALMKQFNYKTVMQVPKLEKIVISQGLGQAIADKKILEMGLKEVTDIAGQKAVQTVSKKDISNFKLRKAMPIGVMVTLRQDKMYEFLENSSPLPCRVYATSRVLEQSSMAAGTIPSESLNRSSSPRLILTRLPRSWDCR